MTSERGDLALARFPFTDGSGTKLRPVLVLARIPGAYDDFLVLFISSQLSQATVGDVIIHSDHPKFASTGLRKASVLRIGKVATLSEELIVGRLGRLPEDIFEDVLRRLMELLRSGHLQSI